MLLVDTSAWINHFRRTDRVIVDAIAQGRVCTHEFVVAELALGSIPERTTTLQSLSAIAHIESQPVARLLEFIDEHNLASTGLGLVDANLLLSVTHTKDTLLWTYDERLKAQAERLGCAFSAI